MKNGFRQSMAWLHTWTGLVVGWVLFFVFVTGNLGRFDTEIDRWMRPELPAVTIPLVGNDLHNAVQAAQKRLQEKAPHAELWTLYLPTSRDYPHLRIRWEENTGKGENGRKRTEEILDPATAAPVEARATGGGQLLYKMHYALHYLPRTVSDWIIGICSMFMLVAIISGVITHKKIFTDFFTFRPSKGQRSWLDFHAVLAVITLPFFLMITYSGLVFFLFTLMPGILNANYGFDNDSRQRFNQDIFESQYHSEPAAASAPLIPLVSLIAVADEHWGAGQIRLLEIDNPNNANARVSVLHQLDSTSRDNAELIFDGASGELLGDRPGSVSNAEGFYDNLLGLHRGLFAGWVLRWLYFLSGIIGAAIIGSGLILWIVKRRPKQLKQKNGPDFGFRLVENLNIGTLAGLPIAIAAYFWANRLLPVDLAQRMDWEVHSFFIVWLAALLYPLFRSTHRAWIELLSIASAAFLLLPAINAVTTARGFFKSLATQDWIFISFDISVIVTGVLFASTAYYLNTKQQVNAHSQNTRTSVALAEVI